MALNENPIPTERTPYMNENMVNTMPTDVMFLITPVKNPRAIRRLTVHTKLNEVGEVLWVVPEVVEGLTLEVKPMDDNVYDMVFTDLSGNTEDYVVAIQRF